MDNFLKNNPGIKILHIVNHKPYHISIIYEILMPINPDSKLLFSPNGKGLKL